MTILWPENPESRIFGKELSFTANTVQKVADTFRVPSAHELNPRVFTFRHMEFAYYFALFIDW